MNKRTGLLVLFLLAFSAMASASTITWSMSGADKDLGLTKAFTSSSGNITITAYGFSGPATSANAQLYGKDNAGDETGLGLDLTNDSSHEITGAGFIQLDISQLAGNVTDFMFVMESVTPPDGWKVLGSNTLGTPGVVLACTATHPCATGSTDEGVTHTISPFPVGAYQYLTFEATAGTVLLGVVSADQSGSRQNPTPEPATLALMGLGLLGLGTIGRRLRPTPVATFRRKIEGLSSLA
jgi:hypothetical protein